MYSEAHAILREAMSAVFRVNTGPACLWRICAALFREEVDPPVDVRWCESDGCRAEENPLGKGNKVFGSTRTSSPLWFTPSWLVMMRPDRTWPRYMD